MNSLEKIACLSALTSVNVKATVKPLVCLRPSLSLYTHGLYIKDLASKLYSHTQYLFSWWVFYVFWKIVKLIYKSCADIFHIENNTVKHTVWIKF